MPRWLLRVLLLVGLVAFLAPEADAQVFKPRTGKGAPVAKAAPAARKGPAPASAAKKPARAATAKRKKPPGKKAPDDDTVVVDDDDEPDVKITDD